MSIVNTFSLQSNMGFELRGSGNEGQPQRVADESQYRHGAFHARRVAFVTASVGLEVARQRQP